MGLGIRDRAEGDGGGGSLPGVLCQGGEAHKQSGTVRWHRCQCKCHQLHKHAEDGGPSPRGCPRVENKGEGRYRCSQWRRREKSGAGANQGKFPGGRNHRRCINGGCDHLTLKPFDRSKFEDGWVAKGLGAGLGCVGGYQKGGAGEAR